MPHPFRRTALGGLVAAMALSTIPLSAGPAAAQLPDLPVAPEGAVGAILDPLEDLLGQITEPLGDALGDIPLDNAVRLLGEDAVDAAISLSQITFETSDIVLLGRDDVFADTLSSVSTQGIAGAPLLLTQTDAMDPRTQAELDRLGATRILVLGSTDAISARLFDEIAARYGADRVTRVGGPSRVETAADLAALVAPDATHAILMRAYPSAGADQSQAYADALSVGPFGSVMEYPALLTTTEYLHPAAAAYLAEAPIEQVTIVGGEAAVGPEVEQALLDMGITATRINGANRWDTSILIARAMGFLDAADSNRIILSEGGNVDEPLWAAGFTAASHGAVFQSPVVLADGPLLPPETLAYLGDGLISNALRLSNLPVICNTFVDFLACETTALLLLGPLDEVNALTGGMLETVLGPAFGPLSEALDGAIPGPGELSPGLVGQILSIIGTPGDGGDGGDGDDPTDGEDPEATFAAAMADQPVSVQESVRRLVGVEGARISASRQAALIDVLGALQRSLGQPVDTADPARAAALVEVLDAVDATLGTRSGELPLAELTALLDAVDGLVGDLVDADALGDAVDGLGLDTVPAVGELTGTVAGLLAEPAFAGGQSLVVRYGPEAAPLAAAVDRITS